MTSLHSLHTLSLKKEMATHSSILAWRIPGTEEQVGRGPWGRRESDTTEVTATGTKLLETGTKFLPSTGWQYFLNVG